MSDFFHDGWSIYIAAATVAGMLAMLALLIFAARYRLPLDEDPKDNTTGHVWDGDLRELNNPLPRWWMWLFIGTVVFAAAYLALYPGLGSAPGQLGWSSEAEHRADQARAKAAVKPLFDAFSGKPVETLARDPRAMDIGERLFANHCATCHGADARGSKGFPNLADSDWLHGGSPEKIIESITQGRHGNMPPMASAVGSSEEIRNLAQYVLSLSNDDGRPGSIAAQLGKPKFAACAACHGADGKGNQQIGAPNLTDNIWLHGWGEEAVMAMVNKGKTNVMPAHGQRLSADQIRVLAAYVWGLSHSATVSIGSASEGRSATP